jgi:predicted nucleic acid-binding protein
LSIYLDTSVLVGLFVAHDGLATRARALADGPGFAPIVSDFVSTEFASVIARLTRMNSLH